MKASMASSPFVRVFAAVDVQAEPGTHFASSVNACSTFESGGKDGVEVCSNSTLISTDGRFASIDAADASHAVLI